MTGRQESNEKIDRKVLRKIKNAPQIIKDYYYSFTNKTSTTRLDYISSVLTFIDYLKETGIDVSETKKLAEVKPSDVNRYMETVARYSIVNGKKRELRESTRASKFFAISNFFEFLITEGYVENNPCARITPPKCTEEKEIVALTPEEIKILKNNIVNGVGSNRSKAERKKWINRDLAIVMLGCVTGLRVSSIVEINVEDVDLENNKILVREKGNKQREVLFGNSTKKVLKAWMADREEMEGIRFYDLDALFISRNNNRISQRAIADMLKKYTAGINKHITPHKMRSSCATNLYEKTGDIYLVQNVLGHKNIANTRRYAKMSETRRREAANEMDDLFGE